MTDLLFRKLCSHPDVVHLDKIVAAKIASPRLAQLSDPQRAQAFLTTNLCGSYLFSRYIVPSFGVAVLSSLKYLPPLDDTNGPLIKRLLGSIEGEICNNNVFQRPGACHAHYRDVREAYTTAGNALDDVERFETAVETHGIEIAMRNSVLWSPGARRYAEMTLNICEDPLKLFFHLAMTEIMTPPIYRRALEHLPRIDEFRLFRTFLERHVALDEGEHGPAAFEWLAVALKLKPVTERRLQNALSAILRLHGVA